jgi:CubicO group peptidase (beta-lactamase class C family)
MVVKIRPGELLADSVADGDVPGVVALAANENGLVYAGAFGEREIGRGEEMTLDTVCWIASMTKAVTSVCAMQLVEQGRPTLNDPLAEVLPHLAEVRVLEGFDPPEPRFCAHRRDPSRCATC